VREIVEWPLAPAEQTALEAAAAKIRAAAAKH
jgi:hypothetical protein